MVGEDVKLSSADHVPEMTKGIKNTLEFSTKPAVTRFIGEYIYNVMKSGTYVPFTASNTSWRSVLRRWYARWTQIVYVCYFRILQMASWCGCDSLALRFVFINKNGREWKQLASQLIQRGGSWKCDKELHCERYRGNTFFVHQIAQSLCLWRFPAIASLTILAWHLTYN